MEDQCELVSSRGLLKSCTIHSSNPRSSDPNDIQHLESMEQVENMSIYVNSHALRNFIDKYLSKIKVKFYLVSGDSDLEIPYEALTNTQFEKLVRNDMLVAWYAQNLTLTNFPKVKPLPIGLDYHTIGNDPNHWWKMHHEKHMPIDQEALLKKIHNESLKIGQRPLKIFSNVHLTMDRYGERQKSSNTIPANLLNKVNGHRSRSQTWELNRNNAFVLSPYGNGYDCHRTWEALNLGAVPIVRAPKFKELFKGLPVLNVENWEDVTEELLRDTVRKVEAGMYSLDKLKLLYWTRQFNPK